MSAGRAGGASVLLVQLGRIGDFILATPMLRALAALRPAPKVTVLASPAAARLARGHPLAAEVLRYDKNPARLAALLAALRRRRFDWWLDPKDHFSREGAFLARWGRAGAKVGFLPAGARGPFDHALPSAEENAALHATARNLRALAPLGLDPAGLDPRPALFPLEEEERAFAAFLGGSDATGPGYVLAHLSARREIRHWPGTAWEELLRAVAADGHPILITADPLEAAHAAGLAGVTPGARHYPTRSIRALLPAVRRARLVVSPDTSVVHVASAFDRPLLGLYSNIPWNTRKFAPLSTLARVVVPPAEQGLLHEIEPAAAVAAYRELVQELPDRPAFTSPGS